MLYCIKSLSVLVALWEKIGNWLSDWIRKCSFASCLDPLINWFVWSDCAKTDKPFFREFRAAERRSCAEVVAKTGFCFTHKCVVSNEDRVAKRVSCLIRRALRRGSLLVASNSGSPRQESRSCGNGSTMTVASVRPSASSTWLGNHAKRP